MLLPTEKLEKLCESFRDIVHKMGTVNDNNTVSNLTALDLSNIIMKNHDFMNNIKFSKDELAGTVYKTTAESLDLSDKLKNGLKRIYG